MVLNLKPKARLMLLGAFYLMGLLFFLPPALAADDAWETYIPPELVFSDDLKQKITVPEKININLSSLNQLLALPGFDEELALKVIRNRPFIGIQDFYRKMPDLGKKNMDRLIEQIQSKILFK
jgi:DNA uptake protein ComE-like DNA-binding protein